jgi:hypothetical protein
MDDKNWNLFFHACANTLGNGANIAANSDSWCSWTTFRRLKEDAGYWTAGLPNTADILVTHIRDGGVWGQPFSYSDIAHIVIPCEFYWESVSASGFESGTKYQNIETLVEKLHELGIQYRSTDLILEIKLY